MSNATAINDGGPFRERTILFLWVGRNPCKISKHLGATERNAQVPGSGNGGSDLGEGFILAPLLIQPKSNESRCNVAETK